MTTDATETGTANTEAGVTTQETAAAPAVVETKPEVKVDDTTSTTSTTETKPDDKPVEYAFTAPEGVELDAGSLDEFKALAAELKLPADQAQKVVDIAIKRETARAEAFAAQVESWGEQVKADKDIGGAKLDENLAIARKAVDTFGSDELKSLLNSTGMGNHPEVVRFMLKVGKAVSEDRVERGDAKGQIQDTAQALYGKTTPN